jgi:aryl-alcohol dehydrogenase-like predicted oxidoreductase
MQYRQLGKSNLQVSALCLGAMMFGDQTALDEARAIVADARAQGVNYIDTADVYTKGASETMTGTLLKGQRHEWVLATKLGNSMSERVNEGHYSRSWMLREIEACLQRLQTDYVDILYLHRDFNRMELEEPLRALDAMLHAGKIRYWGVSNFRGWRIAEVVRIAAQLGMPAPVVCQPYYNLLNRMPEVEVLPACEHYGIGVTPYSPIARGVLTGKYAPGQPPVEGSRAARGDKRIAEAEFRDESLRIAEKLKAHAPGQRHYAGAVRHGLGARASRGQLGDRRASHAGAMAGLLARAGLHGRCRGRSGGRFDGASGASVHARLQRSAISAAAAHPSLSEKIPQDLPALGDEQPG